MKTYKLRAADIFSKWGFDDGDFDFDCVDDEEYLLKPEFEEYGFRHAVLIVLVETHVLPTIPKSCYDNYRRMITCHNPVRADDVGDGDFIATVTITQDDVDAAVASVLKLDREPAFDTAEDAVKFLHDRFVHAGVSDTVAKLYAQDLKKIINKMN